MRVKTIEEIRYENFLILVEEAGSVALFAKKMGKGYGVFSQIKNKSLESKTGNPKGIGSKQAREIETAFDREVGWMDHEQLDQEAQTFKKLPSEVRAWILKNQAQTQVPTDAPQSTSGEIGLTIPFEPGGLRHEPNSTDKIEQLDKRKKR